MASDMGSKGSKGPDKVVAHRIAGGEPVDTNAAPSAMGILAPVVPKGKAGSKSGAK